MLTAAAAVAVLLLYCAWCAFTCGKFTLLDYGVYTSMIRNCLHGDWFHTMVDRNYLYTHLSFSLALLSPFFLVWDHPFLLAVLQWLMLLGGGALLFVSVWRRHVPAVCAAALLFFYMGYRFTQSVMLSEFHTVGPYFLLVPWLYVHLSKRSPWAWLPCIIILGLREDAFIFLLPIILYFAVRHRWPMAYVMAGAALVYGLLALFVIYPSINEVSLFVRRRSYIKDPARVWQDAEGWGRRIQATVLMLLPLLAASRRRFWIGLVFASAAVAAAFMSAYPGQQVLGSFYSAPVMTMMAVGMAEALVQDRRKGRLNKPSTAWFTALALPVVVIAVHLYNGFLPGGRKNYDFYRRPCGGGQLALQVSKHLPEKGVLVTDEWLSGFCGNRRDLLIWNKFKEDRHTYDAVFTTVDSMHIRFDGDLFRRIRSGEFGLSYIGDTYFIAERGYDPSANEPFLETFWMRPIKIPTTSWHEGEKYYSRSTGYVRHWHPRMAATPVNICYGRFRYFEPGAYTVALRYKARRPRHDGSWGRFSLHTFNAPEERAGIDLEARNAGDGNSWIEKSLTFHVDQPARIEPRITAGDAELWLDKVVFESVESSD